MIAALNVAGMQVSPVVIIAAIALLQLIACATMSAFSKAKKPKKGLRRPERVLLGSAAAFAAAIAIAHIATAPKTAVAATPIEAATVSRRTSQGSCNSVRRDMLPASVEETLGKPDEIRSDEETRGTGAVVWIYRDSRCAVHVFDGKVEFVE